MTMVLEVEYGPHPTVSSTPIARTAQYRVPFPRTDAATDWLVVPGDGSKTFEPHDDRAASVQTFSM